MKRLLIDLTDLELWNGQHGGTQRVVYGITKNFFLDKDPDYEICYIAFSPKSKTFHEAGFAPIYERVESLKNRPSQGVSSPTLSLKTRLKRRVQPYVPEAVRRNKRARQLAKKALHVSSRSVQAVQEIRRRSAQVGPRQKGAEIVFQKDDIVLVLGKPWDNLDIQQMLTREKANSGFTLVQLVYDMIISLNPQLHHPSLFTAYTQHMFEAIQASDLLLPISKSTATDVKKFCKRLALPVPPMQVIRLGDELIDIDKTTLEKPDSRIANTFIACVGTIEIRKNHTLLYYAYKLAQERNIDLPQLVIVGGRGWLAGDFQYLVEHDPAMKDKIVILDSIDDRGLSWVYSNCLFTVYPSMYEGWGLPVAEALAYGKFCLASDSSSIPEIAGGLIDYFSPYDSEECLRKLGEYLSAEKLTAQEHKLAAFKVTAWESTTKQVAEAIRKLG